MSEYIVEMYDECEKYFSEYGCKPTNTQGFPLREEIVRCRDCAYICNREYANGLEYHTCSYFDSEHAEVEPDGFCAWGVRGKP